MKEDCNDVVLKMPTHREVMMITLRGLVLLVPVILVGCASGCPSPGYPSPINERCVYTLKVTHVDAAKNEVRAKAGRSYDKNILSSEKIGYGDESKDDEFSFRVKDIDKLVSTNQLQADNVYLFSSFSGSAYLELYTPATAKKVMQYLKENKYVE
jgi:hypothetical protein